MTTQPAGRASLPELVVRNREPVSYGALAAGVLLVALTIFWAIRWYSGRDQPPPKPEAAQTATEDEEKKDEGKVSDRADYLPAAFWSALLAMLCLGAGGMLLTRKPEPGREVHEARLWLIVVGGVAGLVTALLGFSLAWRWQSSALLWVGEGETQEAKWVLASLAIFLAGLALLFFSVQLARPEERSSVLLRRVLYGSNAVVTGLLMLMLLAVVNVVVFVKLPESMITTASAFKGLSPASKEFLHTFNEDATVYLVMPETFAVRIQDPSNPMRPQAYTALSTDCRALMNAVHAENPRIKTKALSPATDDDEIRALVRRLKLPEEQRKRYGLIVTVGKDEELNAFIGTNEMVLGSEQGPVFQGENRLMTELNFLGSGGKKPVVYFTQANAEPSIGPESPSTRTARDLVEYLRERKYDVRPLLIETGKRPDLSEAAVVVVAAPRVPFTPEQVNVLGDYLMPKGDVPGGKLVALLPAFPDNAGNVSATGLEELFARLGVGVERQRILGLPRPGVPPGVVPGTIGDEGREFDHPLTRLMAPEQFLLFGNLRPVTRGGAAKNLRGYNLFVTRPGWYTYRDDKYDSNPDEVEAQLRKETGMGSIRTAREKQVTNQPVPFGVYVAEQVREGEESRERPRLLVIGTDWFFADDALRQTRVPQEYIARMGAMLEFMRERPRGMNIEPRALGTFTLKKDPDAVSLVFLPIGLVVFGITALGVGVWVARRK
jgi:hypothetical protein